MQMQNSGTNTGEGLADQMTITIDNHFEEKWEIIKREHCPNCGCMGYVYLCLEEDTGSHPNRSMCILCGCRYSLCGAEIITPNGGFEHRRLVAMRAAAESAGAYSED